MMTFPFSWTLGHVTSPDTVSPVPKMPWLCRRVIYSLADIVRSLVCSLVRSRARGKVKYFCLIFSVLLPLPGHRGRALHDAVSRSRALQRLFPVRDRRADGCLVARMSFVRPLLPSRSLRRCLPKGRQSRFSGKRRNHSLPRFEAEQKDHNVYGFTEHRIIWFSACYENWNTEAEKKSPKKDESLAWELMFCTVGFTSGTLR